ncbi:MAG TPA: TetR family transcriptional regulator [Solirubrobacteraceae bacterium]|jgi:AcrR family transcriptional regulator|nr:TetR family transcriptional regulator [Solirubrobacteraceae bacterium]
MSHSVESERPQRADAKRNRERIIESARDAFAAHGPETQMDEVARLAGVGVGTVYRHFPTKESLLGELVRQKMERMSDNTRAALDRDGEPFAVFADALRQNVEIASADAALQYAMLGAGEGVWEFAGVADAQLIELTDQLIARAQAAGTMRRDVSALDIPMLMCGVCATMSHTKPYFDWRRHLELIIDSLAAR